MPVVEPNMILSSVIQKWCAGGWKVFKREQTKSRRRKHFRGFSMSSCYHTCKLPILHTNLEFFFVCFIFIVQSITMNPVFHFTKRKKEAYISNCRLLIALWVRCHWCGDLAAKHTIICTALWKSSASEALQVVNIQINFKQEETEICGITIFASLVY